MDRPYLISIEPPRELNEAIVFINGYRSAYSQNAETWCRGIRQAGWKGSIYQLWWDASDKESANSARDIGRYIGSIPGEVVVSLGHWEKIKKRAKAVGEDYLHEMLSSLPETYISLMGYSLGARIIYYGLKEAQISLKRVKNVFLVAGAIDRKKEWELVADNIGGKLINLYNSNDSTLKYKYRQGQLSFHSPCGLLPIECTHPKILNADATYLLNSSSHDLADYLRVMPENFRNLLGVLEAGFSTDVNLAVSYAQERDKEIFSGGTQYRPAVNSSLETLDETVFDAANYAAEGAYKVGKTVAKETYKAGETVAKETYKAGKTVAKGVKKAFKKLF
jgi:hypothetical protein